VQGTDAFYVFLPLTLAGFATAIIIGVQWSLVVISGRDQDSLKHQSVPKGADQ
jgi:hypothetical protein